MVLKYFSFYTTVLIVHTKVKDKYCLFNVSFVRKIMNRILIVPNKTQGKFFILKEEDYLLYTAKRDNIDRKVAHNKN